MLRAPLPEFVRVTFCEALPPTATFPNGTLVGANRQLRLRLRAGPTQSNRKWRPCSVARDRDTACRRPCGCRSKFRGKRRARPSVERHRKCGHSADAESGSRNVGLRNRNSRRAAVRQGNRLSVAASYGDASKARAGRIRTELRLDARATERDRKRRIRSVTRNREAAGRATSCRRGELGRERRALSRV